MLAASQPDGRREQERVAQAPTSAPASTPEAPQHRVQLPCPYSGPSGPSYTAWRQPSLHPEPTGHGACPGGALVARPADGDTRGGPARWGRERRRGHQGISAEPATAQTQEQQQREWRGTGSTAEGGESAARGVRQPDTQASSAGSCRRTLGLDRAHHADTWAEAAQPEHCPQ